MSKFHQIWSHWFEGRFWGGKIDTCLVLEFLEIMMTSKKERKKERKKDGPGGERERQSDRQREREKVA